MFLGIFESACSPPAYSLIADYFPAQYRTTANAVYAFGIYIGGGLSSLSLIIITSVGWRWAFIIVAVIGILSGVIMFIVVREPKRGGLDKKMVTRDPNVKLESPLVLMLRALAEIFINPTARNVTIAGCFRFVGGFAIGYYHGKYITTVYPKLQDEFSTINAVILSIFGFVSQMIGGILSDKYELKSNYMVKAWVCIGGSLLGVPTMAICCFSNVKTPAGGDYRQYEAYFYIAMAGLALEYLVAESWGAPAIAMLQNTISAKNRGFCKFF
jgi:sugar phosphate permease